MPLKILQLEINCGETTCASKPGVFCKYLTTSRFGQQFNCQLFSEVDDRGRLIELKEHQSGNLKGWIARHSNCLKYELIHLNK